MMAMSMSMSMGRVLRKDGKHREKEGYCRSQRLFQTRRRRRGLYSIRNVISHPMMPMMPMLRRFGEFGVCLVKGGLLTCY